MGKDQLIEIIGIKGSWNTMLKWIIPLLFLLPCGGNSIIKEKSTYKYDEMCKGTCSAGPTGFDGTTDE